MNRTIFSLQGRMLVGERLPNGKPGTMFWVGNVPEATLELSAESTTKNESFSGNKLPYGELPGALSGTLTATFDEWSAKNLAMGLYSEVLATVGGSVTDEALPDDLVAGDEVRLDKPYASNLVIIDSTPSTPVTVAPADYRLTGHNQSVLELLSAGAYVQPLKASYDFQGFDSLEAFSRPAKDRYVVFDGINLETGEGVLVDIYRWRARPVANLGLINAEYGSLPMAGSILFDALNVDANGKGGFFRVRNKAAA